jgi:GntR family transcriptional regulator
MTMRAYAVQKARAFLTNKLESGVWRDGEKLPTLIELARAAGVSHVSMGKALELLKKAGLVNARKGSRIHAGRKPA